jgi:hypothetical protein
MWCFFYICCLSVCVYYPFAAADDLDLNANLSFTLPQTRISRALSSHCDSSAPTNARYAHYFEDMNKIYRGQDDGTCLPVHQKCGWPQETFGGKKLPLYVLVVGLEGSGHHFWTKLLFDPLFQCNWVSQCSDFNEVKTIKRRERL